MLVIMANYILLVLFGISNTLYADQDVGGSNSTGRRHRRGLYGSEVTGGFCPSECLCLSEIQVNIEKIFTVNSIYLLHLILGFVQHGQPGGVPHQLAECYPGHQHHQPEDHRGPQICE